MAKKREEVNSKRKANLPATKPKITPAKALKPKRTVDDLSELADQMPIVLRPTNHKRRGPQVVTGEHGHRFLRFWHTLMCLAESSQPVSAQELNARLSEIDSIRDFVGKFATTRNDLKLMVECGFPVMKVDIDGNEIEIDLDDDGDQRGKHRNTRWRLKEGNEIGRIQDPHITTPSAQDLAALSMIRALLQDNVVRGFPLYRILERLTDDLYRYIATSTKLINREENTIRFKVFARLYKGSVAPPKIVKTVTDAIPSYKLIKGVYSKEDGTAKPVELYPHYAFHANGRAYMMATKPDGTDPRNYRLDRFESMEMSRSADRDVADTEQITRLIKGSFGGFVTEPEDVKFIVDSQISYLFDQYQFHPSQKSKKLKNGSCEITMHCAASYTLEEFVLGLGEFVEVKAPKHLRDRIVSRHEQALKKYR